MTTGTWNPEQYNYVLHIKFLQEIISSSKKIPIENYLSNDEQKKHAAIMRLPKDDWFALKDSLSSEEIISLIKFFTLAEMKYADWSAEEKSPVIWLAKMLRQKGEKLDSKLLQWIKNNSNNKFLPYGAL